MNISNFRVEPADYKVDYNDLRFVRESVFVTEQNIPAEIEFDDLDSQCHHVIARDEQHQPLGTARLTPVGKIGRMAVLQEWRNRGVGKSLLLTLIEKARKLGWTDVSVNAQSAVQGFCENFGFTAFGEVFEEAGIPHQAMRLILQPLDSDERSLLKPRPETISPETIDSCDVAADAICQLIESGQRQLCIISIDLDYDLYARHKVIDAFKEFSIRSRGGCVRIIVQDTAGMRSRPHPLVDLAQRLPSIFLIRSPVEVEDRAYPSAFFINDYDGYLFQTSGRGYQGSWSLISPGRTRQLAEDFEHIWNRSASCTELRVLSL